MKEKNISELNSDFILCLNKLAKINKIEILKALFNVKIEIIQFTFKLNLNETLKLFGLNNNINIFIETENKTEELKIKYYYNNLEINPICYYTKPDNYIKVLTIQILLEAIKQNTHEPDIRFLEEGK